MSKLIAIFLVLLTSLGANAQVQMNGTVTFSGTFTFMPNPSVGPAFSHGTGSYFGSVTVTITCPGSQQATYTLDGSQPTIASTLYTAPLVFTSTTTLSSVCSNLQVHDTNTQTSVGNIPVTGIGYKCVTPNAQTFPSGQVCANGGGVSGQPTNVTLGFGTTQTIVETGPSAQVLIPYQGHPCDTCTYFAEDKYVEPTVGAGSIAENEMDTYVYNGTYNRNMQFGLQCDQHSGSNQWQYDNVGGAGWQNTGVHDSCPWPLGVYTHVGWTTHIIIPDTSGANGKGMNYYDDLIVNGTTYHINKSAPSSSTTFSAMVANQDQIGSTASATTAGRNIQKNTVAASIGPPSAVATATYTLLSGGAATPILIPNNYVVGNKALTAPSPVLAFGKQQASTSSPAIPISISNPSNAQYCTSFGIGCGSGNVTVTSMVVSGANASDFAVTGSCGLIASGSDCEPTVTFTPTGASNESATLTVNYSGATTASQTMSLTGTNASTVALSATASPTALSGTTNYQVSTNITAASTNYTLAAAGVDVNLNGHTLTYANASSPSIGTLATYTVNGNSSVSITTANMSVPFTSGQKVAFSVSAGPKFLNGAAYTVQASPAPTATSFTVNYVLGSGSGSATGTVSPSAQVNEFQTNGFNAGLFVRNGTLASGASGNSYAAGHPQSSIIGYVGTDNMASGITIQNTKFNYNIQFANAVEDNNGFLVFHDNLINDSAVGTCASIGCRNQLFATPVYQFNVSTRPSGSSQYYNNFVNGGPQGGLDAAAPGTVVSYNTINPGNVTGNNTNDFAIYAWGTADQVFANAICTPLAANCNTRGIQISGAQTPSITGVNVYNNIIGAYETPTNAEYGGCQTGGAYGLQFDDNPIGPNTAYNNYVVASAKACSGGALRITDSEYLTNQSHNNTFIASRLTGATACVRNPDNAPQPGCANASEWDGPTAFTSLSDTYTGDTCDVLLDISGASGIVIQSPIFNKGSNPSNFHTFCAENGTVSQGGGPVTNFHVIDATFNTGTTSTDTDFPVFNVGNQGDVSLYIDWTQTMTVKKASGPAAVGAVVTWTDTLANTYTCTTNASGICPVILNQYRNNNDTVANQHENHNPYSLSIPLSGCTTFNQTAVTISAASSRNITLSGC